MKPIVMGSKMSPKKRYVVVLNPQFLECDIIWRQNLYRGDQVKMRSLGSALIPHDWNPYRKKKF